MTPIKPFYIKRDKPHTSPICHVLQAVSCTCCGCVSSTKIINVLKRHYRYTLPRSSSLFCINISGINQDTVSQNKNAKQKANSITSERIGRVLLAYKNYDFMYAKYQTLIDDEKLW